MAKAYHDLANSVHSRYSGLKIGIVNCEQERQFCEMFQVAGFPTLILMKNPEAFEDSTPVLYEGNRDLDSMLQFLEAQGVLKPSK